MCFVICLAEYGNCHLNDLACISKNSSGNQRCKSFRGNLVYFVYLRIYSLIFIIIFFFHCNWIHLVHRFCNYYLKDTLKYIFKAKVVVATWSKLECLTRFKSITTIANIVKIAGFHSNVRKAIRKRKNSLSSHYMMFIRSTFCILLDCFGTGHCSFESENCGLKTGKNATLHWTVGSAQRTRENTGPSYDHTLFNEDGKKRHHWMLMLTSPHQLITIQSSMVCIDGCKMGIRNQCHFSNREESNII